MAEPGSVLAVRVRVFLLGMGWVFFCGRCGCSYLRAGLLHPFGSSLNAAVMTRGCSAAIFQLRETMGHGL